MNYTTDSVLKDIENSARQRKFEILNSKSEYPSDSNRYFYFDSENGDDENDGLSPETAFKSIDKTLDNIFRAGDTVLLKRGSLFRGYLNMTNGVCFSAYGEGEKPKIYGSIDGSNPDNWIRTSFTNVWMFKTKIAVTHDVGNIVFNDGECWGIKVYKNPISELRCDGETPVFNGRSHFGRSICKFSDQRDLKNDLEFYHNYGDEHLYLYSPDGNPGKVFNSIEISTKNHIVQGEGKGVILDNLCLKYTGVHAIAHCGHDFTVRNCEIAWIGGSNQFAAYDLLRKPNPFGCPLTRLGNGVEVYGGCNNYVVENCYIHQIYDAAITAQFMSPKANRDLVISNISWHDNLIDLAHYSFELWLAVQENPDDYKIEMRDVDIYNNLCLNNGYGFGAQRPDAHFTFFYGDPQRTVTKFSNVEFHDNVFADSRKFVSSGRMFKKENGMHFLNNKIYHAADELARHCVDLETSEGDYKTYMTTDEDLNALIDSKCWENCEFYKFDKENPDEGYFKI